MFIYHVRLLDRLEVLATERNPFATVVLAAVGERLRTVATIDGVRAVYQPPDA